MSNCEKFKALYIAANELMQKVGLEGELCIHSDSVEADALMNALYDIDGGEYDVLRVFGNPK